MLPLLVVIMATLLLRGAGHAGIGPWNSWRLALLHALGAMFVLTGLAHFGPLQKDLANLLPAGTPMPRVLVALAGAAQIAGGMALFVHTWRVPAAWMLIALELAKLPANVSAAQHGLSIRGVLPTPPALRVPIVFVWIILIAWAAIARDAPRNK